MITRSKRLNQVAYDIRGKIYDQARALEQQGHTILSLHIGDPAPFNYPVPDAIVERMAANLRNGQGYGDAIGLDEAREAIIQEYTKRGIRNLVMEDVYVGNGVSELALISLQALLNDGDEVLVPTPDYPLWSSAVHLFGGKCVYYRCDASSEWYPDVEDLARHITSRTKGIVLINPNNPTGAVYPKEILQKIGELAEKHKLVIFTDEIYDKILYDGVKHTTIASLTKALCLTFSGLTKNYRVPGFRAGWMVISGNKSEARDYIGGINLLANLRVCSNLSAQYGIKAALEGYQHINDLTAPGGRLRRQRDLCYEKISQIPGLNCVKPMGAFYLFGQIDLQKFNLENDYEFVYRLLSEEKVLIVHGSGFNYYKPDHFRVVFLPEVSYLETALDRIASFLERQQVSAKMNVKV
jgi:alanine-synthesizing transaminase